MMRRYIFSLPDDLVADIEQYRKGRGLKSTAEAARELMKKGLGR